jgi:hypothetical protein
MIFEVFISISFNGLDGFRTGLGWGAVPSGAATSLGALFIQNSEWLLCGMKFAPEI